MESVKLNSILNLIGYVLVVVCIVYAVRKLPMQDAAVIFKENGLSSAIYAFVAFSVAMALRSYRFTALAVSETDLLFRRRTLIIFPWLFMVSALGPFRIGEGAKIIWLWKAIPGDFFCDPCSGEGDRPRDIAVYWCWRTTVSP
jgi:hypothetical protein